jgi:hypothetical protein
MMLRNVLPFHGLLPAPTSTSRTGLRAGPLLRCGRKVYLDGTPATTMTDGNRSGQTQRTRDTMPNSEITSRSTRGKEYRMPASRAQREAVWKALRESRTPLTVTALVKSVRDSGTAITVPVCVHILADLVKEGAAWSYPPRVKNQKPRYWHKDPVSAVADRIFEIISEVHDPITIRGVERILHAWQRQFLPEAVGLLVNERRLFLSPRKFSTYLRLQPPRPEEYLLARHLAHLQDILDRTAPSRSRKLTLADMLNFLAGDAGSDQVAQGGPELSNTLMRSWYEQELPELLGSTAVPIPNTWERYRKWCEETGIEPTTAQFHEALSRLVAREEIELIPHDRTEPIPSHEREILMQGPRGESLYYWRWRRKRP